MVTINGFPVADYLESISMALAGQQDPDASYNKLFPSIPYSFAPPDSIGDGFNRLWNSYAMSFMNDTIKWTFANTSTRETENRAYLETNLTGIDSGAALFSKVDLPQPVPTAIATSTRVELSVTSYDYGPTSSHSSVPTNVPKKLKQSRSQQANVTEQSPTVPGYPYPVIKHYGDIVAGYFLNGSDVSDVAVLAMTSFTHEIKTLNQTSDQGALEFQRVVQLFLADCRAQGKKKLIVDLSANGGGITFSGYDAFKQLFPGVVPFGGSRFRDSPVLDYLGNVWTLAGANGFYNQTYVKPWQTQSTLDKDLKPFPDWTSEYGPQQFNGGNFTSLLRFNLSDTVQTSPLSVSGYGNRSVIPPQPFAAEDIVLLYDGYCASTCAIFSDMMKRQAGVRSSKYFLKCDPQLRSL